MQASVILPTRNRDEILRSCLDSLVLQTLPIDDFEVVIIDNGSTDNTKSVSLSYSKKLNISYHYAPEPGLHVGRHEGLRVAKTDLLIYGDDDFQPTPGWVEATVNALSDPSVAMVGGNLYPNFEKEAPEWLIRKWNEEVYKGKALGYLGILDFGEGSFDIDPGYVWGGNMGIRREVLIQAGGFHPDGVPDERLRYRGDGETHVSKFVRESGKRAVFDSGVSGHHLVASKRMSKEYFSRRAYMQGISDSYTDIRASGSGYSLKRLVWTRLRKLNGGLRQYVKYKIKGTDEIDEELFIIEKEMRSAYWRGHRYHQMEVRNDPALLQWVLKESYL